MPGAWSFSSGTQRAKLAGNQGMLDGHDDNCSPDFARDVVRRRSVNTIRAAGFATLAPVHRDHSNAIDAHCCRPCAPCLPVCNPTCRFPQHGPYPWAIVSDPLRAFLFVLVRDPEGFSGSKAEKKVLKKCEKLGFTTSWNSPRKTVQEGCSYTAFPAEDEAEADVEPAAVEVEDGGALSSVLELRGGALGLGGPLHASCKVSGRRIGVSDGPS